MVQRAVGVKHGTTTGNYRYFLNSDINLKEPESNSAYLVAKIFSNMFLGVTATDTWAGKTGINTLYPTETYNFARICVCYVSEETNTETKFKAWLAENRPIVLYQMKEPTNTEITDTTLINQLEAYLQAYSYLKQTNISATSSDLEPVISATAIRSMNDILTRLEILESEV